MPSSRSILQVLPVYGLAALLFGLDQLSKHLVVTYLPFRGSVPALAPWLYFTHVRNIGAAFSIFEGQKFLLSLIALAVIGWLLVFERRLRNRHPLMLGALACILAGAAGNLCDRLRLGYVVDFLDLHARGGNIWPIFNVADICINLGVGLLLLYFWRYDNAGPAPAGPRPGNLKEERSLAAAEASITEQI